MRPLVPPGIAGFTLLLVAPFVVATAPGPAPSIPSHPAPIMKKITPLLTVKKITPLLTVDDVDACLPFWTGALGFELTATVPHGEATGFAMLQKDGLELMYQSRASVADDLGSAGAASGHPELADPMAEGMSTLFIEVEALDAVLEALGDEAEVVVPRRRTFYGMDEVFVRAPCGTLVGFAARLEETGEGGEG